MTPKSETGPSFRISLTPGLIDSEETPFTPDVADLIARLFQGIIPFSPENIERLLQA